MFIAVAEIGFDIGKFGQSIVLYVSKVLADRRDMCGINRQNPTGISENVFAAITEVCERRGGGAIGIGGRVIKLPGNTVFIQQLEYRLCRELRCVIIITGIK